MKTVKTAIILTLIAIMSLIAFQYAFAVGETMYAATLSHGDVDISRAATGGDSVAAFTLERSSGNFELIQDRRNIPTSKIIVTQESGFEGIYYSDGSRIRKLDADSVDFRVSGVPYRISHLESGNAILTEAGVTTGAYRILTEANNKLSATAESGEPEYTKTILLPDSDDSASVKFEGGFETLTLPSGISFTSSGGVVYTLTEEEQGDIETTTAERGSASGEIEEVLAAGCHDMDDTGGADDNSFSEASYTVLVRTGGRNMIVTDYCARGEDTTLLYEAYCDGEEIKVMRTECPSGASCNAGACRTAGEITKFCIDADKMTVMDTDSAARWKEDIERAVKTKGATIGYYAALEGGREFGAWNDYCKDDKTLIEYRCSSSPTAPQGMFREIICPKGCSDGACQEPPFCYDSDGGLYENVKGVIKSIDSEGNYLMYEDTCNADGTVKEFFCDKGKTEFGATYADTACADEFKCQGGKCAPESGTVVNCDACDANNPFNLKKGTSCNADGTALTFDLKRCAVGSYCDSTLKRCVMEPFVVMDDVTNALNRRKAWAYTLDDALAWLEEIKGTTGPTTRGIGEECSTPEQCTSKICAIPPGTSIVDPMHPMDKDRVLGRCAETCGIDSDCVSGKVCTSGACVTPAAPLKANGVSCKEPSDCASGICGPRAPTSIGMICKAKCIADAECDTGTCDEKTGVCSIGKEIRAAGTTEATCASPIAFDILSACRGRDATSAFVNIAIRNTGSINIKEFGVDLYESDGSVEIIRTPLPLLSAGSQYTQKVTIALADYAIYKRLRITPIMDARCNDKKKFFGESATGLPECAPLKANGASCRLPSECTSTICGPTSPRSIAKVCKAKCAADAECASGVCNELAGTCGLGKTGSGVDSAAGTGTGRIPDSSIYLGGLTDISSRYKELNQLDEAAAGGDFFSRT